MMHVGLALICVAAFLTTGLLVVGFGRRLFATILVYGATTLISAIACANAAAALLSGQSASVWLPLGLPWIGANFHIDALSSFFLVIVNLGATGASLFGLGYGRHDTAPHRVLPFFAAFLAGMNLA